MPAAAKSGTSNLAAAPVLKAENANATGSASNTLSGIDQEALVKLITAQVIKQLGESQSVTAK
jgi:hypothetical protein